MEQNPELEALVEREHRQVAEVVLKQLISLDALEPIDVIARDVEQGRLWAASFHVEEPDIDTALQRAVELPTEDKLLIQLYQPNVLGWWIVTGLNTELSEATQYPDEERMDSAFELAQSYLRGELGGQS